MKKLKLKSLWLVLLMLCTSLSTFAADYDFVVDGIYYKKSGQYWDAESNSYKYKSASVSSLKYNSTDNALAYTGDVVIPESVEYGDVVYSVTKIENNAFRYCTGLTSVNIPSSVTSIGSDAFCNCSGLTSMVIPNSVISIGDYAFEDCSSLTSVTIPSSVTSIGFHAFSGCDGLTSVYITDLTAWCDISFSNWLSNPLTRANHLFLNGEEIKDLAIPNSISKIGNYAFWGGSNFTSVTIPNSVTNIGSEAFGNCYSITSLTIPGSVTSIGSQAFKSCSSLSTIEYTGTMAQWCNLPFKSALLLDGHYTLSVGGREMTGEITFPNDITKINDYAFCNVKGLTSVTIPETVTSIGSKAFNSPHLTKIIMSRETPAILAGTDAFNSVAYFFVPDSKLNAYASAPVWSGIADRIFAQSDLNVVEVTCEAENGKIKLAEAVGLGNEGKVINLKVHGTLNGYDIMVMNTKMTHLRYLDLSDARIVADEGYPYYNSYTTEDNVLGAYSFYGLTNLCSIVLPKDITSIGSNAFYGCINLFSVTGMPESCKNIGNGAFFGNRNLQSITLGAGVETIGEHAFQDCSSLSSITIPSFVKTIETDAFSLCSSLKEVNFSEGLICIGSYAFNNCSSLTTLKFPSTLETTGFYSFHSCSGVESIVFPKNMKTIGEASFEYCRNLKELKLPSSLEEIKDWAFNGCSSLEEIHIPSMLTKIGDNAFTNCGAKDVYAYTLAPIPVTANTFDYSKAVLHAPNNPYSVFLSYYTDNGWRKFLNVLPFDADYEKWYLGENQDIVVDDGETIPNKDDEQADGEMQPGSGLTYLPGAFQWLDKLKLNWKGGKFPAFIDNANIFIDELTFCLEVQAGKWYFFSFPFEISLDRSKFNGKFTWRYYDGEQRAQGMGGWKEIGGKTLYANTGYIFQTNKSGTIELTITDPIFTGADKTITLDPHASENAQDAGWNFVGNPNLSYYDVNHFLNHFNSPITVWDPVNNTYNAVMPGDDDYEFHPFEAFFVQKPVDTEGMTFEAENRETSNGAEQTMKVRRRARARMAIDESRLIVNLTISDGKLTDKTRVVFNDEKTMDYEMDCDASKFMSSENVPQLYTLDGKNVKYAINERPNADNTVRLGYTVTTAGTFTIGAPRMDMQMALKDQKTGYLHNFCDGDYEFQSEKGTFENRFMLVPAADATKMQNVLPNTMAKAVEGGISLNGLDGEMATIYNVGGAVVAKVVEDGIVSLPAGTYVVSMGDKSAKLVVR